MNYEAQRPKSLEVFLTSHLLILTECNRQQSMPRSTPFQTKISGGEQSLRETPQSERRCSGLIFPTSLPIVGPPEDPSAREPERALGGEVS
jgi:hypothetical protein